MRFCTLEQSLPATWNEVAATLWERYPNSHSKHVLTEDTLSRHVDPNSGCLITRRLLSKVNSVPAPAWGKVFVAGVGKSVQMIEDSIVDPIAQTFTTVTHNLGLSRVMCLRERCVYKWNKDGSSTLVVKDAIFSSGIRGFGAAIEKFSKERYCKNANRAYFGLLDALKRRSIYIPHSILPVYLRHQPRLYLARLLPLLR